MRSETVSCKARIAGNSWTIGKIRNAAGGRFGLIDAVHELIRGSLTPAPLSFGYHHIDCRYDKDREQCTDGHAARDDEPDVVAADGACPGC